MSALTRVYYGYVADVLGFLKRGFAFESAGRRYHFHGFKEPWHLENGVQEVFIRVFSDAARHSYDGVRPFRNYLYRIARNTVMDTFRARKKDVLDVEETTADDAPDAFDETSADPERDLYDKELEATVAVFVGNLDTETQPFFEARFRDHHSVEACARILGWSEYRVKREEKRIKKQFFHFLKDRGYFEGYRFEHQAAWQLTLALLVGAGGMIS